MKTTIFGRARLGYLLAESQRLDEWERFATEGLGLHADRLGRDLLTLRIDERERRLVVTRGSAEDVISLGWELDDDSALEIALQRLSAMGAAPKCLSEEQAALRGVEQAWSVLGPKRLGIELFTRPRTSTQPLSMRASGFETGAAGLGHLALTTREPEAMQRFWQSLFDARVSDLIDDRVSGIDMDFTFLRINERHHTIAIASTRGIRLDPLRTRIHHLNLQASSFDDVVQGYRRCRELGYPIANAIGQHPNDKELSFYVDTPSGFAIEMGWNPLIVRAEDEVDWKIRSYQGISLWGHFTESANLGLALRQFGRGMRSLGRREYTVGAQA